VLRGGRKQRKEQPKRKKRKVKRAVATACLRLLLGMLHPSSTSAFFFLRGFSAGIFGVFFGDFPLNPTEQPRQRDPAAMLRGGLLGVVCACAAAVVAVAVAGTAPLGFQPK
jgi:hypothetical protein